MSRAARRLWENLDSGEVSRPHPSDGASVRVECGETFDGTVGSWSDE